MPERLTQIDDSNRHDHSKLLATDEILFWLEYTSGKSYDFGRGNQLVSNLKKKPGIAGFYEMKHKARAITECSRMLSEAISEGWRHTAVFVPIPPSKIPGHPQYDSRMEQICRGIIEVPHENVRNLIIQAANIDVPAHEAQPGQRPSVESLLAIWSIDETVAQPAPDRIIVVDDVLTAGVHFRAAHSLLHDRFPQARIVGMFAARRVFENPFEGLDL